MICKFDKRAVTRTEDEQRQIDEFLNRNRRRIDAQRAAYKVTDAQIIHKRTAPGWVK